MIQIVENNLDRIREYCEEQNLLGWDPFDGLNSKIFQSLPVIKNNRLFRLLWIQLFKRSPVNFRRIFKVEKGYNPKAAGLFLSGYCNIYRFNPRKEYIERIRQLTGLLVELQSSGYSGACWGYNFDWQARAFFQPKNTPNVVATSFIGHALLDAYEILHDDSLLQIAVSIADFILKDLNRTFDNTGDFCFSYSPLDRTTVFNASFLASNILGRIYTYTKDETALSAARSSVNFCVNRQMNDGSWYYSPLHHHTWIDSFHSGYNLEALAGYMHYTDDNTFKPNLEKGLDYYLTNFFTQKGIPKYYSNSVYPVDIHSSTQLIMTLSKTGLLQKHKILADKVLEWTFENMLDKTGFFYYQKTKFYTIKISYIRWAQAWMFYALSEYLLNLSKEK